MRTTPVRDPSRLVAIHGASAARDEDRAVAELRDQILHPGAKYALVFVSSRYDLPRLGQALLHHFDIPVYGCTAAGLIGSKGLQRGGLVGASIGGADVVIEPHLLEPLDGGWEVFREALGAARDRAESLPDSMHTAGILLTDGLSRAEERLTSLVYQSLGDIPIVGGSAGDDLRFERTSVYFEGRFRSNAALFLMFSSRASLATLRAQHHRPTEKKATVTDSDPERRLLLELQGEPAAEYYAELVGVPVKELNPNVFSRYPLLVRIGDEQYVRAVQKMHSDNSLELFCALETGLVLAIGEPENPLPELERALTAATASVGEPAIVLGFDCVLRRLHFELERIDREVGELLRHHRVLGFNSYGEQCNAIHMSQTFTALAIGG